MNESIKVIVADDHTIFREGVISIISDDPNIKVVAEAATGKEIIEKARDYAPDVILMDLFMPEVDGIKATEMIARESPHIGIIVLTISQKEDHLIDAIKAGARGYLLKDCDPGAIIRGIKTVHNKGAILSPSVAAGILAEVKRIHEKEGDINLLKSSLTHREIEVLNLVAKGYNNKLIAEMLLLSPATIKNHISNILTKLHLQNRIQAAVFAAQQKLVEENKQLNVDQNQLGFYEAPEDTVR